MDVEELMGKCIDYVISVFHGRMRVEENEFYEQLQSKITEIMGIGERLPVIKKEPRIDSDEINNSFHPGTAVQDIHRYLTSMLFCGDDPFLDYVPVFNRFTKSKRVYSTAVKAIWLDRGEMVKAMEKYYGILSLRLNLDNSHQES